MDNDLGKIHPMKNTKKQPGRPANTTIIRETLVALVDGPATRKALGLTPYYLNKMVQDGLVIQESVAKKLDADGKPMRGRPTLVFKATSKGKKRAQRAIKSAETTTITAAVA